MKEYEKMFSFCLFGFITYIVLASLSYHLNNKQNITDFSVIICTVLSRLPRQGNLVCLTIFFEVILDELLICDCDAEILRHDYFVVMKCCRFCESEASLAHE